MQETRIRPERDKEGSHPEGTRARHDRVSLTSCPLTRVCLLMPAVPLNAFCHLRSLECAGQQQAMNEGLEEGNAGIQMIRQNGNLLATGGNILMIDEG